MSWLIKHLLVGIFYKYFSILNFLKRNFEIGVGTCKPSTSHTYDGTKEVPDDT
jgi:hypothetical protein